MSKIRTLLTVCLWLTLPLSVALGVWTGQASALHLIDRAGSSMTLVIGGWTGDLSVGSYTSHPYTRAAISDRALMALSRRETIYFFRDHDSVGERLREGCSYEISGGPLPARWWSVTLYAADDFLARNEDHAHSISASTIKNGEEGTWHAFIGPHRLEGTDWMSTSSASDFSLLIRLYNPEASALDHPDMLILPEVSRLGCEVDGP